MSHRDLADPKTIQNFMKRARYVATKRGHRELADDFAQELFIKWLGGSGAHQTIDQAFIDYLRSLYGRTGACGSGSGSGSGSGRVPKHRNHVNLAEIRNLADPSGPVGPEWDFAHLFRGREAALYRLYFVEERSEKSIGEEIGVTESRISQLLAPMKEAIKRHAVLMDGYERMEWDESFLSFSIQWATL